MGSSNFASQMLHLCSYNLVNIQILNQVQKFGGIKLHNPKGTTAFATLSHFVPLLRHFHFHLQFFGLEINVELLLPLILS